jgi:hypothetical protein
LTYLNKSKFRDPYQEDPNVQPSNIMHDRRVVRGNTYAAMVIPAGSHPDALAKEREKEKERKTILRQKQKQQLQGQERDTGTPDPVDGRQHMEIQTDHFLEELVDKPPEYSQNVQTDFYIDRPQTPLFMATKTATDIATQIEEGDLFDFDLEVEPILEVLVGRTMHVAMLELMQEDELDAIFKQQQEFEAIRSIELSEVQRLESEARRKASERDRRVAQEKKRVSDRLALEEKVASRAFANQYLSDLHSGIFDDLQDEGYFYDPVKKEIEDQFMPDLLAGITSNTSAFDAARNIADELLNNVKILARDTGIKSRQMRQALKERLEKEAEEKRIAEEARLAAEAAAAAAAEAEGEIGEE